MLFSGYVRRRHLGELISASSQEHGASDNRAASLSRSYFAMQLAVPNDAALLVLKCFLDKSTSCLAVTAGSVMLRQRR